MLIQRQNCRLEFTGFLLQLINCNVLYFINCGNSSFVKLPSMTWFEAKDHCEREGGKLVEIDSKEENNALAEEINMKGYKDIGFWIGLTDLKSEGDWKLESNGAEPI